MIKYIILTIFSCLSLFSIAAYADYYLYIENPDPENFEIVYDYPEPNLIVNDGNGSRACWIIHDASRYDHHYEPTVSIIDKQSGYIVCSPAVATSLCSIIEGKGNNTRWVSTSHKKDKTFAQAYKTWDCG